MCESESAHELVRETCRDSIVTDWSRRARVVAAILIRDSGGVTALQTLHVLEASCRGQQRGAREEWGAAVSNLPLSSFDIIIFFPSCSRQVLDAASA